MVIAASLTLNLSHRMNVCVAVGHSHYFALMFISSHSSNKFINSTYALKHCCVILIIAAVSGTAKEIKIEMYSREALEKKKNN